MTDALNISPTELKAKLDRKEDLLILDVREPWEYQIANLDGKLIPLSELPHQLNELGLDTHIVALCHHGIRSHHAAAFLRQNGFTRVLNLAGGIDRWAKEIDPSMARY